MSWEVAEPVVIAATTGILNSPAGAIDATEWDELDFDFVLNLPSDYDSCYLYLPSQYEGVGDTIPSEELPGLRFRIRPESGTMGVLASYILDPAVGYIDESTTAVSYTAGTDVLCSMTRDSAGNFELIIGGNVAYAANHPEILVAGGVVHFGNVDASDFTIQSISLNPPVPDISAPDFSIAPAVSVITDTSANLSTTIDELGDIFSVVILASDTAPSVDEVIAGTGAGGAVAIATASALAATVLNESVGGLSYPNNYASYFVARDDEGTPNVQAGVTAVNFSTIAPAFYLSSITNATPQAGDTVTFNIANGAAPYTATYKGNALTIDSQDANSVSFLWPDLRNFGDLSANFSTGYSVVITDNNADTVSQSIITLPVGQHIQAAGEPWLASSHFYGSSVADGDWAYFVWTELGNNQQLPANGNIAGLDLPVGTNTLETTIYYVGVWDVATTRDFVVTDEIQANNAPTVENLIPNQSATEGSEFIFQLSANVFSDLDSDTLTYAATMSDDSPLIYGLVFNSVTRIFNWTPTVAQLGTHSITVTADDGNGGTVSDTFDIVVSAAENTADSVNNATQYLSGGQVERTTLFLGVGAVGKNTTLAVNAQSDLDDVLGAADSGIKTQAIAAQLNGGDVWQAYFRPIDGGDDWIEEAELALADCSPEQIVLCTPVTTAAQINAAMVAAESFRTKHAKRVRILCATAGIDNSAQTWAQYATSQIALQNGIAASRVGLVPLIHGNDLGALAGRLCRADASIADSPMRTETGALIGLGTAPLDTDGNPYDFAIGEQLDANRLSVAQIYPDYDGVYWADGNLLDTEGGDYQVIEHSRVADMAARRVRIKGIKMIASRSVNSTPISQDWTKSELKKPLRQMSQSVVVDGKPEPGEIEPVSDDAIVIKWVNSKSLNIFMNITPHRSAKSIMIGIRLSM